VQHIARHRIIKPLLRKFAAGLRVIERDLTQWLDADSINFRPNQSSRLPGKHLALIAGYFSYKDGLATFGDTEALRVVCDWLEEIKIPFDIACHPVNGIDGLNILILDPKPYSVFIYVCGPWKKDNNALLRKFQHCLKIGVNLSHEDPRCDEFDILFCRDSPLQHNPDVVFASQVPTLPLAGIACVHPQWEYGERQRHKRVQQVIGQYLDRHEVARVTLDTLHYKNPTAIRNVVEYENLVGRLDVVISSRLHGMVFALKRGIPVVAIDPIAGGAKVTAQANALGWPLIFNGNDIDESKLRDAVNLCLSGKLNEVVANVRTGALVRLSEVKVEFLQKLKEAVPPM